MAPSAAVSADIGLQVQLEKNHVMSVRGLLGEGTQDNTKEGNTGIMGQLWVSLSFRPGYLPNNSYTKIATVDADRAYRTHSLYTGHCSGLGFERVSFP